MNLVMFEFSKNLLMGFGALGLLALVGCNKTAQAPPPIPIQEVPQTLENAFKNSSAETSQAANQAVSAVRAEEPTALVDLQELSERSDLTQEQRIIAARAMAAYLQKLRETADKGDKKAEEVLEHYRATK